MARKKAEKKADKKAEKKAEKKRVFSKRAVAEEVKKPAKEAVSVDTMIEENKAATISSDYQTYLRKLMKRAGGKA